MISFIIIISLIELSATYMIFHRCSQNNQYEKLLFRTKKENSEKNMYKLMSYFDKVKELHVLAVDDGEFIDDISKMTKLYIQMIGRSQSAYLKKYKKYHTDKETKTLIKILNAEYLSILVPAVKYMKIKM